MARSDPFYYENVQGAGSTLNPQYRIRRLFDADLESVKAENMRSILSIDFSVKCNVCI